MPKYTLKTLFQNLSSKFQLKKMFLNYGKID